MSFLSRSCAPGARSFHTTMIYTRRKQRSSLSSQSTYSRQIYHAKHRSTPSERYFSSYSHFHGVSNAKNSPKQAKSAEALHHHSRRTTRLALNNSTQGGEHSSWSAWEVLGVSFFGLVTSASIIVTYPKVQNEPSVDTVHPPQSQRFTTIVQRAPNRSSINQNLKENNHVQPGEDLHTTTSPYTEATDSGQQDIQAEPYHGKSYDVSVRAVKGRRVTMEDEFYVSEGGRFVAVFDGHGGGGVSTLLKARLYGLMKHYLKETHWEELEDDQTTRMPSVSAYVGALRKAFDHVENDVLTQETLAYQGSTAVAVVLHESDDGHRTLISANVGDSRAILSRRGKAIDLTRDHKPNEEREKARILKMGEVIEWDSLSKVHRVRNLSLSRAIGDRYAKPVVSSQVEIKLFPIAEDGDEFFLLASDGLWDVMSSQEVVSYVHQRYKKELQREELQSAEDKENYKLVLRRNMARSVAREALRRGTGDNVCVLMVWVKDLPDDKV